MPKLIKFCLEVGALKKICNQTFECEDRRKETIASKTLTCPQSLPQLAVILKLGVMHRPGNVPLLVVVVDALVLRPPGLAPAVKLHRHFLDVVHRNVNDRLTRHSTTRVEHATVQLYQFCHDGNGTAAQEFTANARANLMGKEQSQNVSELNNANFRQYRHSGKHPNFYYTSTRPNIEKR
jgi:hypothetical protein